MAKMNKKELSKSISKGESETIELKPSLSQINEIVEIISAFANTKGGKILIGVSNSGKVLGIRTGKDTIEKLTNKIMDNTDPIVYPSISVIKFDDKSVIVIEVEEATDKPVSAFGRAFKRVGKSTLKVSRREFENLILEKHKEGLGADSKICEEATLDDIDEGKIGWFLREARRRRGLAIREDISINDALTKLKLLKDNKLSNAAILLFGKNPEEFFLQSEVKCIALPTTEFVKPYDIYQTYGCNLFEQVDKATAFVLENIRRPLWIEPCEIAARHPYELPREAIREAIVNAVVHRDYNSPSKAQVRVFPDRVEVWNPGELPFQLKIDDLKKPHPSIPHNPLLFRQFYRVSYVEDVGGGTVDIVKGCKNMNLPEPNFEQKMGSFVTTLWRSILTDEYLDTLGLNARQKKAIKHIEKYSRITRAEYEKLCRVSERTSNRELNELVNKKIIEKKGRGPETYYVLARYGEIWRDIGRGVRKREYGIEDTSQHRLNDT